MPPLPIVEELEVFEELGARRSPGGPGSAVDQLDLERREEPLSVGNISPLRQRSPRPWSPVSLT